MEGFYMLVTSLDKLREKAQGQLVELPGWDEELVEPTLDQIEECGLKLTDEQLTVLLNYSQQGVKDLERFCPIKPGNEDNKSK